MEAVCEQCAGAKSVAFCRQCAEFFCFFSMKVYAVNIARIHKIAG